MRKYFTDIPLVSDPPVTGEYGQDWGYWSPANKHRGIDYGAPSGTPIYYRGIRSAKVGRVSHTNSGDFGVHVRLILDEPHDLWTLYGHMRMLAHHLVEGMPAEPGWKLGEVGQTGVATGDHLHHQCYHGGPGASTDFATTVDPMSLIGEPAMPAADPANSILVMERDLARLINQPLHLGVPELHRELRNATPPSEMGKWEYQGDYSEVGLS